MDKVKRCSPCANSPKSAASRDRLTHREATPNPTSSATIDRTVQNNGAKGDESTAQPGSEVTVTSPTSMPDTHSREDSAKGIKRSVEGSIGHARHRPKERRGKSVP